MPRSQTRFDEQDAAIATATEAPRAQDVATPDKERRDQQDEDDRERVLRLQPDPGGDTEQRPRAAPCASRSKPEHEFDVVS
jgi:hypothetical protein